MKHRLAQEMFVNGLYTGLNKQLRDLVSFTWSVRDWQTDVVSTQGIFFI